VACFLYQDSARANLEIDAGLKPQHVHKE
jgi:hypothetical protein